MVHFKCDFRPRRLLLTKQYYIIIEIMARCQFLTYITGVQKKDISRRCVIHDVKGSHLIDYYCVKVITKGQHNILVHYYYRTASFLHVQTGLDLPYDVYRIKIINNSNYGNLSTKEWFFMPKKLRNCLKFIMLFFSFFCLSV